MENATDASCCCCPNCGIDFREKIEENIPQWEGKYLKVCLACSVQNLFVEGKKLNKTTNKKKDLL